MVASRVFQWNLFVDVCFSQHRCSSDRQPPSAHVLLLFGQRCLVHVHRAHWPEQWPHHDLWNRQQLGQPHLSGCTGLLQITHTYKHIHTPTHKSKPFLISVCDGRGFRPMELLMLVCRAKLLMYSLFLFPLHCCKWLWFEIVSLLLYFCCKESEYVLMWICDVCYEREGFECILHIAVF